MTTSQNFWARKLAKQQGQQIQAQGLPVAKQQLTPRVDKPWWQLIDNATQQQSVQETVTQSDDGVFRGQPFQKVHLTDEIVVTLDENGEYRPKKATHLKNSGRCPNCDSGNFGRGEDKSRAMRCFDCGHVEGRSIADLNRPVGATSDAPAQRARQVNAGGAITNNYHGNINTASEAVSYIGGV